MAGPAPQGSDQGGALVKEWTEHVRSGAELAPQDVRQIVDHLMSGGRSDVEAADFLDALHRRGETPGEVAAFASCILERAEIFEVPEDIGPLIDVCGTGGDKLGIFNVSTAVMFVAAGAGAKVVKHGNRKITSRSGGADVLEALGIPVDLAPQRLRDSLCDAGAAFLFAPRFHPAFKSLAAARNILASRGSASIFNMLGPLLNPAKPQYQLAGVFSPGLLDIYAEALPKLGRSRFWVAHGSAGEQGCMDEISTSGPTEIVEHFGQQASRFTLEPAAMGVATAPVAALRGGDANANARTLMELLQGEERGAPRDLVLVNSAAAILVAGIASAWEDAMHRAAESLDAGKALRVLKELRRLAGAS